MNKHPKLKKLKLLRDRMYKFSTKIDEELDEFYNECKKLDPNIVEHELPRHSWEISIDEGFWITLDNLNELIEESK